MFISYEKLYRLQFRMHAFKIYDDTANLDFLFLFYFLRKHYYLNDVIPSN